MRIAVAVHGRHGMLRSLVERVLHEHDGDQIAVATDDAPVGAVVVLVDPEARWHPSEDGARYIVLHSQLDDASVVDDLRMGADAVFGPDVAADELLTAVRVVAEGGCWLAPSITRRLVDALRGQVDDAPLMLTPREHDILTCAAQGLSIKQTARHLGIAPKTVENLQGRMFRKLDVRNRAQAVARAHAAGLLSPDEA